MRKDPQCTVDRLVGTSERVSLLRNTVSTPLDRQTEKELWTRCDRKHVDDIDPNLVGFGEAA